MANAGILKIDSAAWFGHIPLRQCGMGSQGLYVNLLALQAASPDPDVILMASRKPMGGIEIASFLGMPFFNYTAYFKELEAAGVVGVREDGCIFIPKVNVSGLGARKRAATPKSAAGEQNEGLFQKFWALYPKKKAIAPARRAFLRLAAEGLGDKIIDGLTKQLPELLQREPQYRPYPATWLNARNFEDQPDAPQAQTFEEVQYRKW